MSDWDYGQRYNAGGEWNPRLASCQVCGEYVEPEELSTEDICLSCLPVAK